MVAEDSGSIDAACVHTAGTGLDACPVSRIPQQVLGTLAGGLKNWFLGQEANLRWSL